MSSELSDSQILRRGIPLFHSVPIAVLQRGSMPPFDIYLKHEGARNPVLYREHHHDFTNEILDNMRANNIERIYVRENQWSEFRRYIEDHLGEILSDRRIDTVERAEFLYDSAQGLVQEVMLHPRSGELYTRAAALSANTVPFLREERGTFNHLMKVASFDYYTYTHSVNVFVFSTALAKFVGVGDDRDLREFGTACLLHDVGKSQLEPSVLNARGELTDEQWAQMRMHPEWGHEFLVEQGGFSDLVLDVVRHHHEKMDGSGYPDGLSGGQISRFTRICTICDVFDALTTRRCYKDALGSFPALKLMQDEFPGKLDPDLFKSFIKLMSNKNA